MKNSENALLPSLMPPAIKREIQVNTPTAKTPSAFATFVHLMSVDVDGRMGSVGEMCVRVCKCLCVCEWTRGAATRVPAGS